MVFPATANILAAKIGAKNAWGYDLSGGLLGLFFGLAQVPNLLKAVSTKKYW
jgi:3-oxoacyl-[acyl-carrier-protein] synthase-3